MARNKFRSLLVLSIASLTLLAGCDEVKAKPNFTDEDVILKLQDGRNVPNNTMEKIFDALVTDGDTNSERVLNNVLYLYSKTIYGSFFDVDAEEKTVADTTIGDKHLGLKSVVEGGNEADLKAFAEKFSAYGGDVKKVRSTYLTIMERIRESFYGYVKDGSYQERSQFREKKFYDAQIKAYHDLAKADGENAPYNLADKQVEGTFRLSEGLVESNPIVLNGVAMVLDGKKTDEGDAENAYFKNIFGTYSSYIEKNLLPDVFRNLLTTQYLLTENKGQVMLTGARKVDTIALPKDNGRGDVKELIDAYADIVIEEAGRAEINGSLTVKIDKDTARGKYGFPFLNALYKGAQHDAFDEDEKKVAEAIYLKAHWGAAPKEVVVGENTYHYYEQSSFGTTVESWNKIQDNRVTDSSSDRSDFTNSGAYSKETGFNIKRNALIVEDKTATGWFTSSDGVSGKMSSDMSNRLFNIQTANEVGNGDYDATAKAFKDTEDDDTFFKYGKYRGGNYYIMTSDTAKNARPYIVLSDDTYYICRVDEAVKRAKISENDAKYFDKTQAIIDAYGADSGYGEAIIRRIAYALSSNDTWRKSAREYYVEKMALVYHDQSVYDYFVKTFPDLFD